MAVSVADLVGIAGASLIVVAYFLLQLGRLDPDSLVFSAVNGLGAAGILFSLFFEFNLSAFVIESFWLAISLYGVIRVWRLRRQRPLDAGNIDQGAA